MVAALPNICAACRRRVPETVCPTCGRPTVPVALDGRYELKEVLGRGGMGSVFRAIQVATQRAVAIKVVEGCDAESVERFRREAVLTARLEHPNALRVYDHGVTGQQHAYLVMELLNGHDLRKEMTNTGPMELERAVSLTVPMFQALHSAHSLGIIHRDIKPTNVFIHRLPDLQEQVKVMDFGIAILASAGNEEWRVTQTGIVLGTAQYMSPEQAQAMPLDGRTDIYSAGLVFYELLSGVPPFKADTPMKSMIKQVKEPAPPLRQFRPDLADHTELLEVLGKLLAKSADARFMTAGEAATALHRLTNPNAPPPELVEPLSDNDLQPISRDDSSAPAMAAAPPPPPPASLPPQPGPEDDTATFSQSPVEEPSAPERPAPPQDDSSQDVTVDETVVANHKRARQSRKRLLIGVGAAGLLVGVAAGLLLWPGSPLAGKIPGLSSDDVPVVVAVVPTSASAEAIPAVQGTDAGAPATTYMDAGATAPTAALDAAVADKNEAVVAKEDPTTFEQEDINEDTPDAGAVAMPVAPPMPVVVDIRSKPPGAEVTVRGIVLGKTPFKAKVRPTEEELQVELFKPGFFPAKLTVVPDKTQRVDTKMEKVPRLKKKKRMQHKEP